MAEDLIREESTSSDLTATFQSLHSEEVFSQEKEDELLEAFTFFDRDGDGLISTRTIGTVMRALGQVPTVCEETDIVAEFAIEQCNDLDFRAFLDLMKKRSKKFDEDNELRESFKRFDKEETGMLKLDYLITLLTTIGEPLTREEIDSWLDDAQEYLKDGYLKYEELVTLMLSKFNDLDDEEKIILEERDKELLQKRSVDEYGLTEKEKTQFCAAFMLLDTDGDGILSPKVLEDILVALGRETLHENAADIMAFATTKYDEKPAMDFKGFYEFLGSQLVGTEDKIQLRNAINIFKNIPEMDDTVPPEFVNMKLLRHYLKHYGVKLTDDEIDYLRENDNYFALEEKQVEIESLIQKIMKKEN